MLRYLMDLLWLLIVRPPLAPWDDPDEAVFAPSTAEGKLPCTCGWRWFISLIDGEWYVVLRRPGYRHVHSWRLTPRRERGPNMYDEVSPN